MYSAIEHFVNMALYKCCILLLLLLPLIDSDTMLIVLQGDALDSEHMSELTEEEFEVNVVNPHLKGFLKFDIKYLIPFFTRRFTQQVRAGLDLTGES